MALMPITNSMLARITHFCELAATQHQQQNLLCLTSSLGEQDSEEDSPKEPDPAEGTWIKTSMEKLEHFLEAQKYFNYISHPVHLAQYANNMIVEQMMMSTAVRDIANGLKKQYVEDESSLFLERDNDEDDIPLAQRLKNAEAHTSLPPSCSDSTSNQNSTLHRLKAFGGASRGDSFFNDKASRSSKATDGGNEGELPKFRGQRRRRKRPHVTEPFNPNVRDYFGDPFPSNLNEQAENRSKEIRSAYSSTNRAKLNSNAKGMHRSQAGEDISHPHTLGNFLQFSADPIRVSDRKYQMQDDAVNGYLNERKNQQVMDYVLRKPNTLDKSREFLIEVTVYAQADDEEVNGLDICSTIPNYKVEVLGSNTLADLRDALMCENDFVYLKELQHPDEEQDMDDLAKNKLLSAMLLIDNTIYNDTRWPNNFDYASQIIRWTGTQPNKKVGPFKRGDMSATKLEDLTIQFGFPYLFRHLGDCEHVIVFNKARLLVFDDEHRVTHFPRISWISDVKPQLCRIDNAILATWAVLDYDDFPESPMLICTSCLKEFCYNKHGKKRGNFRLYPYRQLTCEIPLLSEKVPKTLHSS